MWVLMVNYEPGVDVVVVNYRTPDDLAGFIDSFAQVQWEVPSSLHVVNVSPFERDLEAVMMSAAKIQVPCSHTAHVQNIGYARACNAAAAAVAKPRQTIAFFNADTRLRPDVLDSCHWHLQQNQSWGVIGPKQVDEANQITHAGIFGTKEQPKLRGWKEYDQPDRFDELQECVSVSGSAYFVKRRCWDILNNCPIYRSIAPEAQGAFLPTPHYYEETWCSYHASAHNWKVVYNGTVTMLHKWHKASPVGGPAEREFMPTSQRMFRTACDTHNIPHD